MADTMQFDLVTPERKLASGPVREVRIPGADGDMTAMPDHAPTITTLRPGVLTVARARKIQRFLSQPFDVAKVFTGSDGVQVPLEKTIASFKAVVAGEYDHLPEAAFYMVGDIEEVKAKAQRLAAEAA